MAVIIVYPSKDQPGQYVIEGESNLMLVDSKDRKGNDLPIDSVRALIQEAKQTVNLIDEMNKKRGF